MLTLSRILAHYFHNPTQVLLTITNEFHTMSQQAFDPTAPTSPFNSVVFYTVITHTLSQPSSESSKSKLRVFGKKKRSESTRPEGLTRLCDVRFMHAVTSGGTGIGSVINAHNSKAQENPLLFDSAAWLAYRAADQLNKIISNEYQNNIKDSPYSASTVEFWQRSVQSARETVKRLFEEMNWGEFDLTFYENATEADLERFGGQSIRHKPFLFRNQEKHPANPPTMQSLVGSDEQRPVSPLSQCPQGSVYPVSALTHDIQGQDSYGQPQGNVSAYHNQGQDTSSQVYGTSSASRYVNVPESAPDYGHGYHSYTGHGYDSSTGYPSASGYGAASGYDAGTGASSGYGAGGSGYGGASGSGYPSGSGNGADYGYGYGGNAGGSRSGYGGQH